MNADDIFRTIRMIVYKATGAHATPDSRLPDLGYDSLMIVEFMLQVEDAFPGLVTDIHDDKLFTGPLNAVAEEIHRRIA